MNFMLYFELHYLTSLDYCPNELLRASSVQLVLDSDRLQVN